MQLVKIDTTRLSQMWQWSWIWGRQQVKIQGAACIPAYIEIKLYTSHTHSYYIVKLLYYHIIVLSSFRNSKYLNIRYWVIQIHNCSIGWTFAFAGLISQLVSCVLIRVTTEIIRYNLLTRQKLSMVIFGRTSHDKLVRPEYIIT